MANVKTNKEVISELIGDVRRTISDEIITNRYALQKLHGKANVLISRFGDNRQLYTQADVMTTIEALKMIEVPLSTCGLPMAPTMQGLKRSESKLPDFFNSKYGPIINILPFDYLQSDWLFNFSNPKDYASQKRRKYQDARIKYWWIIDDYLFVPEYTGDYLRVQGMFLFPSAAKSLDCSCEIQNNCFDFLNDPFVCPDFLQTDVIQLAATDMYRRAQIVQEDVKDMNDSNRQTARP